MNHEDLHCEVQQEDFQDFEEEVSDFEGMEKVNDLYVHHQEFQVYNYLFLFLQQVAWIDFLLETWYCEGLKIELPNNVFERRPVWNSN